MNPDRTNAAPWVGQQIIIDTRSLRETARGLRRDHEGMADAPAAIRRAVALLGPGRSARINHADELAVAAAILIQSLVTPADWLQRYADEIDSRSGRARPPIESLPLLPPTRPVTRRSGPDARGPDPARL